LWFHSSVQYTHISCYSLYVKSYWINMCEMLGRFAWSGKLWKLVPLIITEWRWRVHFDVSSIHSHMNNTFPIRSV
jgi:hypothetical protein